MYKENVCDNIILIQDVIQSNGFEKSNNKGTNEKR